MSPSAAPRTMSPERSTIYTWNESPSATGMWSEPVATGRRSLEAAAGLEAGCTEWSPSASGMASVRLWDSTVSLNAPVKGVTVGRGGSGCRGYVGRAWRSTAHRSATTAVRVCHDLHVPIVSNSIARGLPMVRRHQDDSNRRQAGERT